MILIISGRISPKRKHKRQPRKRKKDIHKIQLHLIVKMELKYLDVSVVIAKKAAI